MASRPQFLPVQTGDCKEEENKLKTLSIGRTNGEHLIPRLARKKVFLKILGVGIGAIYKLADSNSSH